MAAGALQDIYDTLKTSRVDLFKVRALRAGPAYEQPSRLIVANDDFERAAMILGGSVERGQVYEVRLGQFPAFSFESHGLDVLAEWGDRGEPPVQPRVWVARSDVRDFDKIDQKWGPPPVPGVAN